MAKRVNLLLTIDREIGNGRVYIDKNGYFVTADAVEKDKKDLYIKALKENPELIDKGVTLEQFEKETLSQYRKAEDILKELCTGLFSGQELFVEDEEPQETVTTNGGFIEPAEPQDAEPQEQPKKGKNK